MNALDSEKANGKGPKCGRAGSPYPPCHTGAMASEPHPEVLWAGIDAYGRWINAAFSSLKRQQAQEQENLLLRLERQSMSLEDLTARQVGTAAVAQSLETRCSSVPPGGWAADDSPLPWRERPPWHPLRGGAPCDAASGRLRGAIRAGKPLKPTSKSGPRLTRPWTEPKARVRRI